MISQVLTVFKADTSDMKAKLKELTGEEKKLAQAALDGAEARNKSIEMWTKGLAKATVALGAAAAAGAFVVRSIKSVNEEMRLVASVSGVSADRLTDAFGGLVSRMDALRFASQTAHGALKLNQGQMETLAQAAVAFRARGFELEDTLKKLTDAAVKADVGGLKDLGLTVQQGASKAETLRNMMAELNKVIAESGPTARAHTSDVEKLAAEWDNAKQALSRYTVEAIKSIGSIEEVRQRWLDHQWQSFRNLFPDTNWYKGQQNFAEGLKRGIAQAQELEVIEMPELNLSGDIERRRADQQKRAAERARFSAQVAKDLTDDLVKQLEIEANARTTALSSDAFAEKYKSLSASFGAMTAQLAAGTNDQRYTAFQREKRESFLESAFGPIEEFDAYATAFETLSGGVSASMQAWITDSMSVGQAFKKFIGEALSTLSSQMAVEALKHGAYALGSLAFGDVRGAGQHAAAAAAFGFGATAAAVAARTMGKGGTQYGGTSSSAGASAGSGSGASSGGASAGSGESTVINYYIVGDSYAEDSPRMRQRNAERVVSLAEQRTSAGRAE